MRKISGVLILSLFITLHGYAQDDSLQARLVLIGDAGDLKNGKHPVIDAVRETIKPDRNTTILYLGDNLYTTGLPDEHASFYDIRRSVLDTQIAIANGTDAKVYFVPGNHDWDRGHKDGWQAIVRQQQYIDQKGGKNVKFYPGGGCGGPVEIQLSHDAVLVIFDSQWWIHPYDKPGVESDCPYKTKPEILNQLEDILLKNSKKLVILACHHPFKSYGIHGGYFTIKQHIFPLTDIKPNLYVPLPLIGSVYPVTRGVFGTPQDLSHPAYQNMIHDVQKVVKSHPNVVFVSGHEHNLQYIRDSNYSYIISGSGTKHTRVSPNENLLFSSDLNGFAVLNISKRKTADIAFYTVNDSIKQAFKGRVIDFSKVPIPPTDNYVAMTYVPHTGDSITVAANPGYAKVPKFQKLLNGTNYRNIWATPVKLKVFRLSKEWGGFTITNLGGGHQTKSLRLKDKNGKEWRLRTINKDITQILPPGVQRTAAEEYLQDFISSAHPYSPVIIPTLAKAVNVVAATPKIYFVPDDPALGIYRAIFANSVCLLEQREPTPHGEDTKSEQKTVNKLLDDNDSHVDQQAFLRARLLDFLIADWDRHFGQWRFAEKDTGTGKLYYPIPRDRDQAFSYSNGLLVKYATQNFTPFLKGFRKKIPDVKWLAYWAKDLDRTFLTSLDLATWKKTIAIFRARLTDNIIDTAVKNLPPEIYAIDGKELSDKLKSRRDYLPKEAMKYYKFLSKQVNVVGSNKNEFFKVASAGKNLQVRVYKRTEETDSASLIYNRIFEPSVTKEIDLYGLNGNDVFEVDKNTRSGIKLRIVGGKGNDTFNINGSVKNYLYDFLGENNSIRNRSRTRNKFENDPKVNRFSTTGFNYDKNSFRN
jgi:predicted phosphodiesterase